MYEVILVIAVITLIVLFRCFSKPRKSVFSSTICRAEEFKQKHWDYTSLASMIHRYDISMPAMIVDVDIFDENVKLLADIVRASGKTLRVATKSVRCPMLIKRIVEKGQGIMKGFMCFSVHEAALLTELGLDDFFIAYPTLQRKDVKAAFDLCRKGKKVTLTVDCVQHVIMLNDIWQKLNNSDVSENKLRVAIDLDMSYRGIILNQAGAHRSRVDSVEKFAHLAEAIRKSMFLTLVGVMGYEGHIAGLPDDNPHSLIPSFILQYVKAMFYKQVCSLRKDVAMYCRKEGIQLEFFNGGGSGNIRDVCKDEAVTEVTAGSAFLQGALFDYFISNECNPAFAFALQVCRSGPDYICCQSGGFVASGPVSKDKCPVPFANTLDLQPYSDEAFGEVQTPLKIRGQRIDGERVIDLGDPVFFRPAKSGEIAEHFNLYYLRSGYHVLGTVETYRGLGKAFY